MTERPRPLPPRPIRSYTPRYRRSDLTEERMATLMPRYGVPPLPLVRDALVGRAGRLILEIGTGHGAAALAYARVHPEAVVIAAEVHVPGVARMLAVAEDQGLANLRVYLGDAVDLLDGGIPDHSLDRIHLLFPDPWPKKKHAKRRLVQRHTLDAMARLLLPDGVLLVASDHPVYAEHLTEVVGAHTGFVMTEVERPEWKTADGFEQKGLAAGRPARYWELRPVSDAGGA